MFFFSGKRLGQPLLGHATIYDWLYWRCSLTSFAFALFAFSSCDRAWNCLVEHIFIDLNFWVEFRSVLILPPRQECKPFLAAILYFAMPILDGISILADCPLSCRWRWCWCWCVIWCLVSWSQILCLLPKLVIVVFVHGLKEGMDKRLRLPFLAASNGFCRSYWSWGWNWSWSWSWSDLFLHFHIIGLPIILYFRVLLHLLISIFLDIVSIASWSIRCFLFVAWFLCDSAAADNLSTWTSIHRFVSSHFEESLRDLSFLWFLKPHAKLSGTILPSSWIVIALHFTQVRIV